MQGKIADFGIPDIFQLISGQTKSGSLTIVGDGRQTMFLFSEGQIVDVQVDERRSGTSMIGNILVDAGYLSSEDLKKILAKQQRSGRKLGELLVEEEKISSGTLARYLYLQIKESVYFTLRIKNGEYRFEGFAVRPPPWLPRPVRPDVLLMEGVQFLDEYDLVRAKLPPGRFQVTRRMGTMIDPSALSEEEKTIWEALDYSTDPWRIFRKACITWFEGVKALVTLQDRGLLSVDPVADEPRPEPKPEEDPGKRHRKELALLRRIAHMRAVLWLAAAAAAAWWIQATFLSPSATRAFSGWVQLF